MNPIVILWAHPRSMSTALERVMRERGDFECLHEPFLRYYYLEREKKELPHFDTKGGHPVSYADTRNMILTRAEETPVFAKDMSYYVIPELLEDVEFCRHVRHCFLIRNPLRSIMSYYKLDHTVSNDEIGLEAQWQHLRGLEKMGIDNSVVIEAEAVQTDTAGTMRLFWETLGLEFRAQALSWQTESVPQDWQYVEGWHASVSESGGIRQEDREAEVETEAEFEALCEVAPQLREFLDHHKPFYRQLQDLSLTRI